MIESKPNLTMLKLTKGREVELKKPNVPGFVCIVVWLLLVFALSGCGQTGASNPPENPAVPKPDEMYIITDGYVARVSEASPWFNIFWGVADRTTKADSGTKDTGWENSIRSKEKLTRPPVAGLEESLEPGQVVFKGDNTGRVQSDLASTALILWYKDTSRLFIENDPLPKTKPEIFKQEMDISGYPIEETAGGPAYWVRMIMIRPGSKVNDGGLSYTLLVENLRPPQAPPGSAPELWQENPYFHGWKSRPVDTAKYDPRNDFKKHLPRFEKKEVYKGRNFWLGSCRAGGR